MILSPEEIEVGPLYVDALVQAGKIDEAEFSFAMNGLDTDESYLDIGSPISSRVDGGLNEMVQIDLLEDFFWSQYWQGVNFNPYDDTTSYSIGNPYTILDTGSSHMFLPETIFYGMIVEMIT